MRLRVLPLLVLSLVFAREARAFVVPFDGPNSVETLSDPTSVRAADFARGGDLDLVAITETAGGAVTWFENVGGSGASWTAHTIAVRISTGGTLSPVDLDGDGDVDVLATLASADATVWYENTAGDGSAWAAAQTVNDTGSGHASSVAGDFDRDGDLDVEVGSSGTIRWFVNEAGDGSDWSAANSVGARASGAPLPALNIAGQPVVLGIVELDPTTVAPSLTLDGVGTTSVFGPPYVDSSNTTVTTPLVQVGGGYNAPSDYDADGRSDDLDNCPYTANVTQANNGGFLTTTPDLYGDLCQCADGDGNGAVFAADTAALRSVLTAQASAAVASRCSVAGGPECDVRDYAVFRRALAGLGPGISSVCASAVRGSQLPAAP